MGSRFAETTESADLDRQEKGTCARHFPVGLNNVTPRYLLLFPIDPMIRLMAH